MITKQAKNILIADDSLFFRVKLSDIFCEAGHHVRLAHNGTQAIKEIENNPEGIDLLVLDLQMPHVDGFGVLEWISKGDFKGKFPVLAITSVFEPSEVTERLKQLGAIGLMTKGFTPEQIVFRVNRILFADVRAGRQEHSVRVPVSIPMDYLHGDAVKTGFLLNLSESGTFLHTREDLLVGSMITLRFSLPGINRVFEVKGFVRWSTEDISKGMLFGGSGIMFTSLTDEEKVLLRDFVSAELKKSADYR